MNYMKKKYVLFPFNKVGQDTRIAIYGAGEIFASFKRQNEALNYCEIAWVIDKKFNVNFRPDAAVCISPLDMPWQQPDHIIIASIAFADEIEQAILNAKGDLNNIIKITERNIIDESFKSNEYWSHRYISGANSGAGSYNHLAEFKANIINGFVSEYNVKEVIEFGCGDGNQLGLANYAKYLGFDVSSAAVNLCKEKFKSDKRKGFKLVSEYNDECAELALSLDVIFHLTEDDVYEDYMSRLFLSASKYIIIYSSNKDLNKGEISEPISHVKHRKFSTFIERYFPKWTLKEKIDNKYAYNGDFVSTSFSDFFIYMKK